MDQMMMMKLQVYTMSLLMVVLFPAIQGNLEMERRCNLQMDSSSTDGCHAHGHSAYPAYSCKPCAFSGGQEVHIINMYQATSRNVPVTILSIHPVRIKLLLSSLQIVHWKISKPDFVTISQVILMGMYHAYSSVTLTNGMEYVNVTSRRRHFQLLDATGITAYARSNLGAVSSFSAVFGTCGWWLAVGSCISSKDNRTTPTQLPDAIWTPPDLTDCSNTLPCWIKYDFRFPLKRLRNQCTGDRYVTWYRIQDTTYYIGAILCTNSRYSLFMSTSMRERFLHITDANYRGEDHCELVGTDREYIPNVNIELENTFLTGVMAYSRRYWGKPFQKVDLTVERKVDRRPRWYECGITIPYAKKLYSESDGSKALGTGAIVGIVLAVLIGVIILAICYRKYRKRTPLLANNSSATQDGVWTVVSPNSNEHMEPSAPGLTPTPAPSAPMLPDLPPTLPTEPLGERLVEEGAPPAYEDALNYPLAKPTQAESSPPAYEDAIC